MFLDPSMHKEIARLRHQELLARGERHRLAKAALADRQKDRGGWLSNPRAQQAPSPATTARRPRGAES